MTLIEYICEQSILDLFNRYSEATLGVDAKKFVGSNQSTAKVLPSITTEVKNSNLASNLLQKINQKNIQGLAEKNLSDIRYSFSEEVFNHICNQCYGSATEMAKVKNSKKNSITSGLLKFVPKILDSTSQYMKLNQDIQNFTNDTTYNFNNDITSGKKALQTSNAYKLNNLRLNSSNVRYVECTNPLYEGEYQSGLKKTAKATILTLVVFVITMILTNVIRIYLGGTPGGDFSTGWQKGLFAFFTHLILAPILEEPAKMISIKGGYGKHFFFAFNFLEFGGYILAFLASGMQGLGVFIILRGICVIFHAISMLIMKSGHNGPLKTVFKLAICIILHFIFNALFIKYAGTLAGLGASQLLMFAMGFFGVAFGIFKIAKFGVGLVKKGVNAMTGK